MMNAKTAINDEQRQQVEQAIADVEQRTSANIVCAVATESGRYERAEAIVGLVVALLGLSIANAIHLWLAAEAGEWTVQGLAIGWQALSVVLGFVAGTALALYVRPLRKLFVSEQRMQRQVERSASHVFVMASPGDTAISNGLLIYVSLFEHRITIRAGEQVHRALGDEQLNHLRDIAVDHLKRGEFAETFMHIIREVDPLLTEKLPAKSEADKVDVPEHMLRFHPRPISSE